MCGESSDEAKGVRGRAKMREEEQRMVYGRREGEKKIAYAWREGSEECRERGDGEKVTGEQRAGKKRAEGVE